MGKGENINHTRAHHSLGSLEAGIETGFVVRNQLLWKGEDSGRGSGRSGTVMYICVVRLQWVQKTQSLSVIGHGLPGKGRDLGKVRQLCLS